MYRYQVGQPYISGKTVWPETPRLRIMPDGIELAIFLNSPTAHEIKEHKNGPAQWAWVDGDHVGLLCFRLGTMPWSDTPYEAWRAPADERGTPPGNTVTVMLVDAATGIIRALRVLEWTPDFLASVLASIDRHLSHPYDPAATATELDRLYQHGSDVLARDHATARQS